jgi:two-component sensor histidine kinase
VVSELVTNALKYAPAPVLLDLRTAGAAVEVVVVVWDCDPVLPVARAADVGRVGQHGLEIVMAVVRVLRRSGSRSANASHRPHRTLRQLRGTDEMGLTE